MTDEASTFALTRSRGVCGTRNFGPHSGIDTVRSQTAPAPTPPGMSRRTAFDLESRLGEPSLRSSPPRTYASRAVREPPQVTPLLVPTPAHPGMFGHACALFRGISRRSGYVATSAVGRGLVGDRCAGRRLQAGPRGSGTALDTAVLGWSEEDGRYADVRTHPDAVITPGVVVSRIGGRLFFANAHFFKRRVWAAVDGAPRPVRHVVLDAAGLSRIDAGVVDAVAEVHAGCRARNITLEIARATSELRERFDATGLTELLGPEHFHPTVTAAIDTGQP